MREIKFKAIAVGDHNTPQKVIYGIPTIVGSNMQVAGSDGLSVSIVPICPGTERQFINAYDVNDEELYERDRVSVDIEEDLRYGTCSRLKFEDRIMTLEGVISWSRHELCYFVLFDLNDFQFKACDIKGIKNETIKLIK